MKELQSSTEAATNITAPQSAFKGYTIEELRYQRALVALQKEFCATKIRRNLGNLQKSNPLKASSSSSLLPGKFGSVVPKLLSGLNYLDYALIGFSVFGTLRKITSIFRKKKK